MQTQETKERQGIRKYTKYIGYGVGAIGMDLSYGLFNTYLSKYFTDILYIRSGFLAIVTFFSRIWDGINDPLMGTIVDNTRSKHGKFRPWIVLGTFLNAIVLVFLFTNPGFAVNAGNAVVGLYVYVMAMYVLWGMTNTVADIPYWSMVPTLTRDPKERNIVATIPRFFSGLGQIIIVVLTPSMIKKLGDGTDGLNQKGFTNWVAICAVILVLCGVISFVSTRNLKEVVQAQSKEKFTLGKAFQTIKNNDQLLIFMIVAIFANTGWYILNALAPYFFENVLGELDLISIFGIIAGGGQALGLLLLPILTKKMERNTAIKIAFTLMIIGFFGMYVFGSVVMVFPLFALFGVICCVGVGSSFVSQTILLSDIVDYGEYKLGYRSDSIVFSMKSLLQKVAYSIQTLVMYFGFELTQYDGSLKMDQPQSAITGINVMMFLIPPVFAILALVIFSTKYKLNAEKMRDVQAYVEAARAQEAAAVPSE